MEFVSALRRVCVLLCVCETECLRALQTNI